MRNAIKPDYPRIYARVFLACIGRPAFLFWTLAIVAVSWFMASRLPYALILKGARPDKTFAFDQMLISAVFLALVCAHFAAHLAAQALRFLEPPDGHVLPRARTPVIAMTAACTIAALAVATLCWPTPFAFAASAGSPANAGALAAFAAALFAWLQCAPTLVYFAPSLAGVGVVPWIAIALPAVRRALADMLAGRHPGLALALYAAAAVLFVALYALLALRRQPVIAPATAPWPNWLSRRSSPDGALARRSPFRLRLFLTAAGMRDGVVGATCGTLVATIALVLQRFLGPAGDGASLALSLMMTILVPLFVAVRAVESRPALVTFELMLPQPRRAVARDLALAMFLNTATAWLAAQAAMFAVFACVDPADFRLFAHAYPAVLAISAAYEFFFVALLACYLTARPTWPNGAAFFTVALIIVPFLPRTFRQGDVGAPTVAIAATLGFLTAGSLLALAALRRWSTAELRL